MILISYQNHGFDNIVCLKCCLNLSALLLVPECRIPKECWHQQSVCWHFFTICAKMCSGVTSESIPGYADATVRLLILTDINNAFSAILGSRRVWPRMILCAVYSTGVVNMSCWFYIMIILGLINTPLGLWIDVVSVIYTRVFGEPYTIVYFCPI